MADEEQSTESEPMYDIEAQMCIGKPGEESEITVAKPECLDCVTAQLLEVLPGAEKIEERPLIDPPISLHTKPLEINLIGIRRSDSLTNEFDDEMCVLYRTMDLEPDHTLTEGSEDLTRLNVTAVEEFISDSTVRSELGIEDGDPQFPGQASLDDGSTGDRHQCGLHPRWRMCRFKATTEPGFEKKTGSTSEDGVATGTDDHLLGHGRAVVQPGVYPGSHRLFVHHWSRKGGYVALSQTGKLDIRRARSAANVLRGKNKKKTVVLGIERAAAVLKKGQTKKKHVGKQRWQVAWERSSEGKAYEKKKTAHKVETRKYERAKKKWERGGKKGEEPTEPDALANPPDPTQWLEKYLASLALTRLSLKLEEKRSKVREIRSGTLDGDNKVADGLAADFTATLDDDEGTWSLEIKGLKGRDGSTTWALADDDIIVVNDYDTAGINIHRAKSTRASKRVFNWSEGCQVFSDPDDFAKFRRLCQLSKRAHCPRKADGASSPCPGGDITADDLVYLIYTKAKDRKGWPGPEDGPEFVIKEDDETRTVDGRGWLEHWAKRNSEEVAQRICDRVQKWSLSSEKYGRSPIVAREPTKSEKRQRKKDLDTALEETFWPELDDAVKSKLKRKGRLRNVLLKVYNKAVKAEVNEDESLRDVLETTEEEVRASSKRKLSKSRVTKAARRKKPFKAAVDATTATQEEAVLAKAEEELKALAEELEDAEAWTADEMMKDLGERADGWKGDGLERCDVFNTCKYRYDYTLNKVTYEQLQALDERWEEDALHPE